MTFKDLRKNARLTQAKMSELLNVDIRTIRSWERGNSKPPYEEIPRIASLLDAEPEEVARIFRPITTKHEEYIKRRNEIAYRTIVAFNNSDDINTFFNLISILSTVELRGLVLSEDRAFQFNHVLSDSLEDLDKLTSILLMDNERNRVLLSKKNVLKVKPLSYTYDVFNFEIIVNYPVFPSSINDDNRYSIRLVIFVDNGEKY